jgi:hypothetical protein
VSPVINLGSRAGIGDGYRKNLPLEQELTSPIRLDCSALGPCHPMFLVRLRLFIDWHRSAGREVVLTPPRDHGAAQHLMDMGVAAHDEAARDIGDLGLDISVQRLNVYSDVERLADRASEMLQQQTGTIAQWGDALHMAIGELCDNALQHGANPLGVYVAADRIESPRREFRLAIADLGIGIPEHIRAQHPEWQDDTAAISRALTRGVTGTGDRHRGNGFAEVLDVAVEDHLVRTRSAAQLDIRSANGRVTVDLVGGVRNVSTPETNRSRRGTWITYTIVSA